MSFLRAHLATVSGAASNLTEGRTARILYIVDRENWAVRSVGAAIAKNLDSNIAAHLSTTALGARRQIVHFGSIDMYMTRKGWRYVHPSNHRVVTIFHISPIYRQTHLLRDALTGTTVHTTNSLTKEQLIDLGVPEKDIHVIPLGVDIEIFQKKEIDERGLRKKYGVNPTAHIIGSFQKDGVGWGKGEEPKLIKGPDTLVETLAILAHELPIHVFLAGPARGYVIRELTSKGIPHTYLGYKEKLADLVKLYHALDLYLITARVEGGPMQILEAWAAGVPLVATPVGMIRDIATNNTNCLLAPVEDAQGLAEASRTVLQDTTLRDRLVAQAQQDVQAFSWPEITRRYSTQLYQPHLQTV